MSDVNVAKGRCLCGAVRVTATRGSTEVGVCHCGNCRRWGGGPLLAIDCGTDVAFEGQEQVSVFNSSDWAERGFCAKCGTHLFYRLKHNQQYIMPAGLFGDLENDFVLDHQIFIDKKPAYYAFSNKTKDMTGAEVFAKSGPS